jgi:hypothetical protein
MVILPATRTFQLCDPCYYIVSTVVPVLNEHVSDGDVLVLHVLLVLAAVPADERHHGRVAKLVHRVAVRAGRQ